MNILKSNTCTNITSTNYFNRILFVWVHLEQTRYTFFFTRTRIIDIRTCFNLTRVNTEECQTTYIRVSSNLKCQCRSLFIIAGLTIFLSTCLRICSNYIFSIQWRRQECANIVKQCLYTFILEWRTTQHRNYSHLYSSITKSSQHFFFCNSRRIIEIFLHQSIVKLCHLFEHLISPFVSFVN